MVFDVLVVGSGTSGANAAYPLVEAGFSVGMLDVGNDDTVYASLIPEAPFSEVRRTCGHQHRFFLGDHFEGVPLGQLGVGPQLTPPRQFISKDVAELTPIDSPDFYAFNSLALGGQGRGWGAGAFQYSEANLRDFPISRDELVPHYEKVAERIGVSGEEDDLLPYEGKLRTMLLPLEIDKNAETILERYNRRRAAMNAAGIFIGKPRLAALSRPHRGRKQEEYRDMSFWTDSDQSVWRPFYTLNELKRFPNFTYLRPYLVQTFREQPDGEVQVISINRDTGQNETHRAKKLVLAASVMGTARIVLKSLNQYETRVPLVCNPYTYYPMLNLNMLGKDASEHTHSLAQLCVVYDPDGTGRQIVHGRLHSYRSLLNFKLIRMMPLAHREAMRVVQLLAPNLAILALDHEDRPSPDKYCMLHASADGRPDRLEVVYSMPEEVRRAQVRKEKAVLRQFFKIGCIALKRVWSGYGISLHYGGTFPMTHMEKPLTTDSHGLLRQTRSVYIADGSVLPYVPAKGLTFTIMAIANRVGEHLCKELRGAETIMSNSKTVLVTGAGGFLGSRLCDYFREQGVNVRALVRDTGAYPFKKPGITLFKGELPDNIDAAAFENVDIVVHCAYATRFSTVEEAHRVNHDGTARVYELSKKAGVKCFVFISSTGAHAQAESYYSKSKFELEKMFDLSRDIIIRPGLIIGSGSQGNYNRMKETLRNSGVVPVFDGGHQILQTIHIDDLCKAIDLATEKNLTGILVVAEPEGLEMRDFFRLVAESMGKKCTLVPLPMGLFLALLRVLERFKVPFPITSENLLGLKQMKHMPSRQDLEKIGIRARTARESVAA